MAPYSSFTNMLLARSPRPADGDSHRDIDEHRRQLALLRQTLEPSLQVLERLIFVPLPEEHSRQEKMRFKIGWGETYRLQASST